MKDVPVSELLPFIPHPSSLILMDTFWLGYDALDLPFAEVVAVLIYQPALDVRIIRAYGRVPQGVRAVVVTASGLYLPARWQAEALRQRWAAWRRGLA